MSLENNESWQKENSSSEIFLSEIWNSAILMNQSDQEIWYGAST